MHGGLRRVAGRNVFKIERFERQQRAAVERSGQGGAAGVGDLGAAEAELLELWQHSSRRRTCRRRTCRRHEGSEALIAERVVRETEKKQRGQPPQGRREGHQARVADASVAQSEDLEPRQGASAQGGGKGRGACVAHVQSVGNERAHGRQRARAQPRRQPQYAVGAD
eukprot:scaffold55232_cov63-Phaeocystis_antarctica.AAC.4